MAYVAKSQRVWDHINSEIQKLFHERQVHAHKWDTYGDIPRLSDLCYRALISSEQETHMHALPREWFRYCKDFDFEFKIVVPTEDGRRTISAEMEAKNSSARPYPLSWSRYDSSKYALSEDTVPPEMLEVILKREEQINAIAQERTAFTRGAKALYTKAKSVNQFVKLWEPALGLLERDIVERLKRPTKRANKPEDQGITQEELNALNSSFVKAKISQ